MPRRLQGRFLATVMFTDIVGSTELASKLGDREWRGLLGAHNALVRNELKRFGGREMDTQGDAFFVAFARATASDLHSLSQIWWIYGAMRGGAFVRLTAFKPGPFSSLGPLRALAARRTVGGVPSSALLPAPARSALTPLGRTASPLAPLVPLFLAALVLSILLG